MFIESTTIINIIIDNVVRLLTSKNGILVDFSLSHTEVLGIFLISRYEEMNMGSIAEKMNMPVSTTTGIIDRLVKKGYVERVKNEKNRRTVNVALTDEGKEMVEEFKKIVSDQLGVIDEILNEQQKQAVKEVITKLAIINEIK